MLYNKKLYCKNNGDYWNCRHPDCSRLIKVVNQKVVGIVPQHPMHYEVTEIYCLKAIKTMKDEAISDTHTDLKVIYDRNIKLLTDKGFKLVDISEFINPYLNIRGNLQKCRQK